MADKEIGDLTDGGAVQSGDLIHAVRGANSRRVVLGTAAGKPATDFATATQGGKADTAAQKAANLSDLANVLTARSSLKIVTLTQSAYDALTKDADTLYFIPE